MTNIGFGCVKLTSNLTRRQAIKNLEVAYDCGIRHFDVARLYGFGLAEGLLGKFASDKRDKITITSKLGILPNGSILKNLFLQNVIRSTFRLAKKFELYKSAQGLAGHSMRRTLDLATMRNSLATSLKELNTDYIDYLLLHEAYVIDANKDELVDFLQEQKKLGVIKAFGVGSFTDKLEDDFDILRKEYTVLQTDNSFPATIPPDFLKARHIDKRFYFSPFNNLSRVKQLFKDDKIFANVISDTIGFDVQALTLDLFLMQQRYSDPTGTFLFTSADNNKIKNTVERWAHIQTLPENADINFYTVRHLIRQKLESQNIK